MEKKHVMQSIYLNDEKQLGLLVGDSLNPQNFEKLYLFLDILFLKSAEHYYKWHHHDLMKIGYQKRRYCVVFFLRFKYRAS